MEVLKQLQLDDEDFLVAAAVANASAHFHLIPGAPPRGAASAVGRDTRCAAGALNSQQRLEIPLPHVAFVSAKAAASAVSDRLALRGGDGAFIGQLALEAVRGAAPEMPPEVQLEVAMAASAEATAPRMAAPAAVVAVLKLQQKCPGKTSVVGARTAAAAVARHCVVDINLSPATCGFRAHDAASDLVELVTALRY